MMISKLFSISLYLTLCCSHAFVVVKRYARGDFLPSTTLIKALPIESFGLDGAVSNILVAAEDAGLDESFQDQINFLDEPIQIMLGVFVTILVLLGGLSVLSAKVDDAIYQTIQDFESTLRKYFPQTWRDIEPQLKNLGPEERDIKLLQIMEEMQEKEPQLMGKVRQKMDL